MAKAKTPTPQSQVRPLRQIVDDLTAELDTIVITGVTRHDGADPVSAVRDLASAILSLDQVIKANQPAGQPLLPPVAAGQKAVMEMVWNGVQESDLAFTLAQADIVVIEMQRAFAAIS